MPDYWSSTNYIRSDNLEAIEQSLTQIFKREGTSRIAQLPQFSLDKKLPFISWEIARELWIVRLFVGVPGWTIIQTWPSDLLCRRDLDATRPRLSELAMQTGSDAIHFGVYNTFFSILMEADASGRLFISGDVDCEESEKDKFYDEQINVRSGEPQFQLIEASQPMLEAMRIELSPEEKQLKQLAALSEDELWSIVIWDEEIDGTEDDWWESSKSNARKRDEALWNLLKGSYYYYSLRELFERAFAQQEKEIDGERLLYFQPAEFYRNLSLTELFSKY